MQLLKHRNLRVRESNLLPWRPAKKLEEAGIGKWLELESSRGIAMVTMQIFTLARLGVDYEYYDAS